MISEDLKSILTSWGVEEEYFHNFGREKIKVSTLLLLSESSIAKLFPEEGPRLEFSAQLDNYRKQSSGKDETNKPIVLLTGHASNASDASITFDAPELIDVLGTQPSLQQQSPDLNNTAVSSQVLSPQIQDTNFPVTTNRAVSEVHVISSQCGSKQVEQSTSTPTSRKRPFENYEFDVQGILKQTVYGKVALAFYNINQCLDESNRNTVADELLSFYLKDDVNKSLPTDVEARMAEGVVKAFPNEPKEVWAVEGSKRHTAEGRGKILNRFYNMRRQCVKNKLISKNVPPAVNLHQSRLCNALSEELTDEEKELLKDQNQWLQNSKHPWTQVSEFWKNTSKQRLSELLQSSKPVHEYMDLYPALKDPSGYMLLELDFDNLYPGSSMKLYSEWPMLSAFIESKLSVRDKQGIEDSLTKDGKKLRILFALNNLFPVVTVIKKNKKQWRPSRIESKEGLLLIVKGVGEIQTTLAARRTKYEGYGLKLGPQAVCVGQDEDNISASYVIINQIIYEVDSPLKALDITFKCMHALDTPFHRECHREWLFLQTAVYGIAESAAKEKTDKLRGLLDEFARFKSTARIQ